MTVSITEAIAGINGMAAYTLANMADTHCPHSLESEGASFLSSIRDAVAEQLDYLSADAEDMEELIGTFRDNGSDSEIADAGPSIYTFQRFKEFTDLCAWQEDISDYAGDETDMEKLAGIALYMIAERLVSALLDYVANFEPANTEGN